MTHRMYRTLIASLSVAALMLAVNEAFARPAAAHNGGFTASHSISHLRAAQALRHHRGNNAGTFWPAVGGFYDEPSNGEPTVDVTQPTSDDMHHRYTYDVPWDWAHRYPPAVIPSERPYVPSCPAETVTVPGRDGREQTVNVMRCY